MMVMSWDLMEIVAPSAGAWIEMFNSYKGWLGNWSLPPRERGLKFAYAGLTAQDLTSLPPRERGLKLLKKIK